jgi:hypothetical protein
LRNIFVASELQGGEIGAVNFKFLLSFDVDDETRFAGQGSVFERSLDVFRNVLIIALLYMLD